jgi:hypothetical protein
MFFGVVCVWSCHLWAALEPLDCLARDLRL